MPLTLGALMLPTDLFWADEFSYTPIVQNRQYSLGGALIVEEANQLAGQPITLEGTDQRGWATRSQVLALQALAANPAQIHTLTLPDTRSFNVAFARPAFKAEAVVPYTQAEGGDYYALSVFLITV